MDGEITPFFGRLPFYVIVVGLLKIIFAFHFTVAPKGKNAKPVFDASDFLLKKRLAPTNGKSFNIDPHKARGEKMPKLMDKYHNSQPDKPKQNFIDIGNHYSLPTKSSAIFRAALSTARIDSIDLRFSAESLLLSKTYSTIWGISRNFIFPFKNASTAVSLAAL